MVLKKPSGFDSANLGKTIKKNRLKSMFIVTLPILIIAYCIGLLVALNFEKGIITSASRTKIQIVYVIYSTFISAQFDSVFLKINPRNKNEIDDQKIETVAVDMTLFLFSSLL